MDRLALAPGGPVSRHRRIAEADALEASQAAWGRAGGRTVAPAQAQPTRRGRPDRPASGMDRSVSS